MKEKSKRLSMKKMQILVKTKKWKRRKRYGVGCISEDGENIKSKV